MSMNRLANMFLNKDVDAIYLTTNQKNPYLINLANQTKVRFIGTLGISEDKLKMAFPFGFRKYIDTSHYYPNINQTAFLETYATRALLVTNTDLEEDSGIILIDDDLVTDTEKELEERRAYLEEARSQDSMD